MRDALIFEIGLAIALIAAASLVATKLRISVIPFYILIGMAVGPHAPQFGMVDFRFIVSSEWIQFMGRLGILLLLFYLGLEFSITRLMKSGKAVLAGGVVYIALNFVSGLLLGWLADLPLKETMVVCGVMTSSSTAIVAKVLVDLKRTANRETELIMGMIMFDDLFIAIHMSVLTGLVLSGAASAGQVLLVSLTALLFIVLFLAAGRKLLRRVDGALAAASPPVFLVLVMALLLFVSGFSEVLHVAEAIGALMMGLVLGESAHVKRIERMILPMRDFFGAIFFFSFGLTIDPASLGGAVGMAVTAVLLTIGCNFAAGMFAGRLAQVSMKASMNIGFTLVARGEFSIIMANIGKAGGLLPVIQSFSVLYVLLLAVLGPLLAKESGRIWKIFSRSASR